VLVTPTLRTQSKNEGEKRETLNGIMWNKIKSMKETEMFRASYKGFIPQLHVKASSCGLN
jgi:hypothetical protein